MSIKFSIKKEIFIFIILMSYKSNIFSAAATNTKKPGFFGNILSSAASSIKNNVKQAATNVVSNVKTAAANAVNNIEQSAVQAANQGVANIINSAIQPTNQSIQNVIPQVEAQQTLQPLNNNAVISQAQMQPQLNQSIQQPVSQTQTPMQIQPTQLQKPQLQQSPFQNIQENNLKNPAISSENIMHENLTPSDNIIKVNPETPINTLEKSSNNIAQTNIEPKALAELKATQALAAKWSTSANMTNALNNASNIINKSSQSDVDIAKNQADLNKSIKNSVLDNNPNTMTKVKRESQNLWTNANKLYDQYVPQQIQESLSNSKNKIQSSLIQGAVNIAGSASNLATSSIERGTKELENQTTNLANKIDSGINSINNKIDNISNNIVEKSNNLTNQIDNTYNNISKTIEPAKQEVVQNIIPEDIVTENKPEAKKTSPTLSKILNRKAAEPVKKTSTILNKILNKKLETPINLENSNIIPQKEINNSINQIEKPKVQVIKDEKGNPIHLIKYNDITKENDVFNLKPITSAAA